jgi:hypothetical protein
MALSRVHQAPTRVIDIQRGFREIGALRMGSSEPVTKNGKTFKQPKKSGFWILTSNDKRALEVAAQQFGGQVQEWPDADSRHSHRLVTKMVEIPVMISPSPASQSYELWSGGECKRRCNGEYDRLNQCPCQCPEDHRDRTELSKTGKACKLTTRVGFILPSVPDLGVWRLETHGYYGGIELPTTTDFLQAMAVQGAKIPALLAIEVRKSRSGGVTKTYPVPVVRLAHSMNDLAAIAMSGGSPQSITAPSAPQLGERIGKAPDSLPSTTVPAEEFEGQEPLL